MGDDGKTKGPKTTQNLHCQKSGSDWAATVKEGVQTGGRVRDRGSPRCMLRCMRGVALPHENDPSKKKLPIQLAVDFHSQDGTSTHGTGNWYEYGTVSV